MLIALRCKHPELEHSAGEAVPLQAAARQCRLTQQEGINSKGPRRDHYPYCRSDLSFMNEIRVIHVHPYLLDVFVCSSLKPEYI